MINVLQINSLRKLIPANQLIVSPSKPRNSHLIDTRNKNPTYGICSIMHAACHATSDLKFGSYTALSSSSPMIEALKLVTVDVESRSQTPSLWLKRQHTCGLLTVHTLYWQPCTTIIMHLCSYWGCGQVFHKHAKLILITRLVWVKTGILIKCVVISCSLPLPSFSIMRSWK